jgi:hypothetical protein
MTYISVNISYRQQIFTIIASVACITNAALSVFTMDVFNDYTPWFRMWFFILFQWICFAIQVDFPFSIGSLLLSDSRDGTGPR